MGGLHMLVSGSFQRGIEIPLERLLLLGIEYANGDRASTLQDPHLGPVDIDRRLVLRQGRGGGSDRTVDHTFWVSPLPPEGPVTFVMAWPALGVTESHTVVDGAPHSRSCWPSANAVVTPTDARARASGRLAPACSRLVRERLTPPSAASRTGAPPSADGT